MGHGRDVVEERAASSGAIAEVPHFKPNTLFSPDGFTDISSDRLLLCLHQGERLPLQALTGRVQDQFAPHATSEDVERAVFGLVHTHGVRVDHHREYGMVVKHSPRSYTLYLDILTSIFQPWKWLELIRFPGTGEIKNEMCGKVKGWHVCKTSPAHYRRPNLHSCNRKECPECYPNWINQQVDRSISRIEGYNEALERQRIGKYGYKGILFKPRHFTFSPSDEIIERLTAEAVALVTRRGREDYMREDLPKVFANVFFQASYAALEKSGLSGAAVIPHFFRIKPEYREFAVQLSEELNEKRESWKIPYNRYTALTTLENYHQYLRFSPHVHVIAYGKAVEPEEFMTRCPGWTYRNHRTRKGGPGGTIRYLLTHCPVIPKLQIIRYWGCLSIKRLRCVSKESEEEYLVCPECGDHICPAEFSNFEDGSGDLLRVDEDNPVTRKIKVRTYGIIGPFPPPYRTTEER